MAAAIDFNEPTSAQTVGSELATSSNALARQLRDCSITDTASLAQAVLDRQALGDAMKRVEAYFEPLVSTAYQLHRMLCDRRKEILTPLQRVDNEKKRAITEFKDAQDREREQREREEAERQRREDQDRAAAIAAVHEQAGDHELAAAVLEEAIAAPPPTVVLADVTKQVEGLNFRRRFLWRYAGGPKDIASTPPAIIARTMRMIPREFLMVDEKKISAYARSMKGSGSIPGVEFFHQDDPVR